MGGAELSVEDLDLTFSAQVEVSAEIAKALKESRAAGGRELVGQVFKALMQELCRKWRKPKECGVHSLVVRLAEVPPSRETYDGLARRLSLLPELTVRC